METSASPAPAWLGLLAVQRAVQAVARDRQNPHLRNSYATLTAVLDAAVPHLAAAGCVVSQPVTMSSDGAITVETMIVHAESGEWIRSTVSGRPMGNKGINDLQAAGVTISYLRRYALLAILGLGTADDTDGEPPRREERHAEPRREPAPTAPAAHQPPSEQSGGGPRPFDAHAVLGHLTRLGYTEPMLTEHIGRPVDEWRADDAPALRAIAALRRGREGTPHALVPSESRDGVVHLVMREAGDVLTCGCERYQHAPREAKRCAHTVAAAL